MNPTLAEIQAALDAGRITTSTGTKLRRNGQTQLWVRSPGRFRIPVKTGFRATGQLTEHTVWAAPFSPNSGLRILPEPSEQVSL